MVHAFDNDDFEQDEARRFSPETAEEQDELFEDPSDDSQIDDPVRMYLMQMGEIPMLNRQQEIEYLGKFATAADSLLPKRAV